MNLKIEYFKNNLIKKSENIFILNESDDYTINFGKQWRDYRDVQIDSINNFKISRDYLLKMLFNNLSIIKDKTILEIGGGAGRFTEYFSEYCKECVSIDLSSSVYYNISKNQKNTQIIKADFNILIPNKKFDIIFCRGVLQHTKYPLKSLLKIHTFVKNDGFVFFDIYKMPKIGYLHPKYFFWRPLFKSFISYEKLESFLKKNIKHLLRIKRTFKKIFFNSDFVSDCIIPVWDYKDKLHINDDLLEQWSIMDTLDGIYAKYDYPQSNKKIINYLNKNGINILKNNKKMNIFATKTQ